MKRTVWSLLLFATLVGIGAAEETSSAPSPGAGTVVAPNELRVLTYNVLADAVHVDQRVPELLRILRESDADIIALQEVATWFAREHLLREPWVKGYHRAEKEGLTLVAHEFIILSKFPVLDYRVVKLPSPQHRVLLSVTVEIAGAPTTIATCHLDSLLDDGPIRAAELDVYFGHLAPHPEAIFLGDFNFGDGEQPETGHLPADFRDAWLATNPGNPGFTWDIERSRMARRESFPGEGSRRLDRILIKSARWQPVSATIVGDAPAPGQRRDIFPSDHFGLMAVFRHVGEQSFGVGAGVPGRAGERPCTDDS